MGMYREGDLMFIILKFYDCFLAHLLVAFPHVFDVGKGDVGMGGWDTALLVFRWVRPDQQDQSLLRQRLQHRKVQVMI